MISAQAKLLSSLIMIISSVVIAQISKFEPLISQGFDQLLSGAILLVGVVTLWRALVHKEKEISKFKEETIDRLIEIIKDGNGKKDS